MSTSAEEAKELNILTAEDQISINQDHLLYDAKKLVLTLSERATVRR